MARALEAPNVEGHFKPGTDHRAGERDEPPPFVQPALPYDEDALVQLSGSFPQRVLAMVCVERTLFCTHRNVEHTHLDTTNCLTTTCTFDGSHPGG